nr:hypothetical protein GCM10025732_06670 [Glycomyces mayteni]
MGEDGGPVLLRFEHEVVLAVEQPAGAEPPEPADLAGGETRSTRGRNVIDFPLPCKKTASRRSSSARRPEIAVMNGFHSP